MEERIVELEVRIAYQDKLLRDLDEVVAGQGARIDMLVREIAELRGRVEGGGTSGEITDEPPPHY